MNLVWAAIGAAAGLAAGALLRGLVFRLSVPAGAPDRVACPGCAARTACARMRKIAACRGVRIQR